LGWTPDVLTMASISVHAPDEIAEKDLCVRVSSKSLKMHGNEAIRGFENGFRPVPGVS
jgi:hypothetical protein